MVPSLRQPALTQSCITCQIASRRGAHFAFWSRCGFVSHHQGADRQIVALALRQQFVTAVKRVGLN